MKGYGLCLLALLILILSLQACAVVRIESAVVKVPVEPLLPEGVPEETIERNDFPVTKGDEIVGEPASMRLGNGDTLPDIARHFSLGINEISAANPGVDVWVPKAGAHILLPLRHILPDCPRQGIVINLAAMRLFQFKRDGKSPSVSTYPVGVGTTERPSPMGRMYVQRKMTRPTWYVPASIAEDHRKKGDPLPAKVPPGPLNPLGDYALYLSKPSYLVHGTNKPYSIGLNATNGCIRLYPEDVKKLYESTAVTTPVLIVNQPYLLGRHDGVLYLEVHAAPGDRDVVELERAYAKLRNIEKRSPRSVDWTKVEQALAEARGVPVPISAISEGPGNGTGEGKEVRHPDRLYGRPETPALKTDAWYVSAAELRDRTDAMRLAAIINHQGPHIPARVLTKSNSYGVLAGPFNDLGEARDAARRLKIDLEIEGVVTEGTSINK